MKFTEAHVYLMLRLRDRVEKQYLMSATRQKLTAELKEVGLVKEDAEGYIYNSERGDNLMQHMIEAAQDYMQAL